jgi:hypothetical protein
VELIASLRQVIRQQGSVIENVKANLTEIGSEQQTLDNQNVELQVVFESLRAQVYVPEDAGTRWGEVLVGARCFIAL